MRQLVGAVQLVQAHRPLKSLRRVAVACVILGLGACAVPPGTRESYPPREPPVTRPAEPPVAPKPSPYGYREDSGYARSAEEVSGPAVINLLNQARSDLAAGRAEQAMASLETALQIERRNPFVWQEMAQAHLRRHQPEDAEITAQRSNGFARGNPYIEIENWRVIAAARQARGDRAGAAQARDKVAELQERLED
jgi:tetratricopeptide (TPR) repeat protein